MKILYSILAVLFLAVVVTLSILASVSPTPQPVVVAPGALPPVVAPAAPQPGDVYENAYMKLRVPSGWRLTEVTETLQNQVYDKTTGKTTKVGKPITTKNGAVNISKGKYILYINPQAGQASGVTGGRFAEIAMGAPSADAVVTEQPNQPCGNEMQVSMKNGWPRHDWYVAAKDKTEWCAVPAAGKSVWYFSYVTDAHNGYINYYGEDGPPGWVITMGYNSKDVNTFPVKGNPELTAALAEMTGITNTVQFTQWPR